MRILRGLSSRILACGCLAGIYETYDKDVVSILDERGEHCRDESHQIGKSLPDLNRSPDSDRVGHG
jgi:hypothetical protein